jgi:hypothetical protein
MIIGRPTSKVPLDRQCLRVKEMGKRKGVSSRNGSHVNQQPTVVTSRVLLKPDFYSSLLYNLGIF